MDVNKINRLQTTPLRNSSSANKPYCSPFNNNNDNTRKRRISEQPSWAKRLKTEIENDMEKVCVHTNSEPTHSDLNTVKKRIHKKRQNIKWLKTRISYSKKHKTEELEPLIEKWRQGCKEALDRFLKDAQERQDPTLNMTKILSALGIPKSLVYNTNESTLEDTSDI